MSKTTKNLVDAMRAASEKKTSAYDTRGTVTRIEDGVAWVHIPGGVDETPVKLTINAKAGDTVQVRVGGGGAFLVGNATAPPTDDARANEAFRYANSAAEASAAAQKSAATASEAAAQAVSDAATAQSAAETAQNSLKSVVSGATTVEKAVSVMQTALEAVVDYDPQTDTTKEYFWHDANGAHVLGTSGAYRNDITSNGMRIVSTATEKSVAEFSTNGIDLSMPAGSTTNNVNYMSVKKGTTATVSRTSATVYLTAGASDEIWLSAGINKNGFEYYYDPSTMNIYVNGTKQTGSFRQFKGDVMVVLSNVGGGGSDFRVFFTQEGSYTYSGTSITLNYAPSEGLLTVTNGSANIYTCHVEYKYTETHAKYRMGTQLVAEYDAQTVLGKYNDNGDNALEIGNGADGNNRSNALTVDWSGNVEAAGDIEDGSGNVLSAKANSSSVPTNLTDLTVDVITNSKSNVSIPRVTYTNLGQVTLPANGKYLIIGEGGCGAASNATYFSLSTYTVSGSPTVAWSGTQQAPTNGGGQCSIMAYYATGSASAVIGLRGYLYGNGSTSGGWGQIVAIRIA